MYEMTVEGLAAMTNQGKKRKKCTLGLGMLKWNFKNEIIV
jgi:hypothetical protein